MADEHAFSLTHRVAPARRPAPGAGPGLLLLHGRGADETDLLGLAGALDPRLTVIAARAPFPWMVGYYWYEMDAAGVPEPESYAAALAALERFVGEAPSAYGVDPARLQGLGFSQGAVMAGGLLLRRPALLAGAILLSGYLPPGLTGAAEAAALRGKPVFIGHGRRDPIIPVAAGRSARDELARLGAAVAYHEYPIEHAVSPEELADLAGWLADVMRDAWDVGRSSVGRRT